MSGEVSAHFGCSLEGLLGGSRHGLYPRDFLLEGETARRLYHEFAEGQPIIDYHNHLPPEDIAADRQFANLFEVWLEGDHYKWRAMRTNGEPEGFVTGDATAKDKIPRLRANRSSHHAQSALPLDASEAEALFRDRYATLRGDS